MSLKTKYKFIQFEVVAESNNPALNQWICKNNRSGDPLCYVRFDKGWKRHVASDTNPYAIFSSDCLQDIADFLDQLQKGEKPI